MLYNTSLAIARLGTVGLGQLWGWEQMLNRRAACMTDGRPIRADEIKLTLGWPSLQARRDYLKCVLVYECHHGMAPLYVHSEFRHAHQVHS